MMIKMANTSVYIPWKYHVIFKPFDVTFLVFILLTLTMVTGQHLADSNEHQHHHHHNNRVCNHQHPKANDVRSISLQLLFHFRKSKNFNCLLLAEQSVCSFIPFHSIRLFVRLFLRSFTCERISSSIYLKILSFLSIRFRFIMKFYCANLLESYVFVYVCIPLCVSISCIVFIVFKNVFIAFESKK